MMWWDNLWTLHFLAVKGEYARITIIYQDNKRTILLAENSKTSSSKRTCHLNVRYDFLTDQIKKDTWSFHTVPCRILLQTSSQSHDRVYCLCLWGRRSWIFPQAQVSICTGVCWRIEDKIWNCEKIQKLQRRKIQKIIKFQNGEKSLGDRKNSNDSKHKIGNKTEINDMENENEIKKLTRGEISS